MAFYSSKKRFETKTDGFYGVFWRNKAPSDSAMIVMPGDDSEDRMATKGAKWLSALGCNVMTMSPGKKDYGHQNLPLERFEKGSVTLAQALKKTSKKRRT